MKLWAFSHVNRRLIVFENNRSLVDDLSRSGIKRFGHFSTV